MEVVCFLLHAMADTVYISMNTSSFVTNKLSPQDLAEYGRGILYPLSPKFHSQFCFQAVAADFKNESAVSLTNAVNRHLQEANERKNKGDDNW